MQVPDGFPGFSLPVPRPTKGLLYVKLRDDPAGHQQGGAGWRSCYRRHRTKPRASRLGNQLGLAAKVAVSAERVRLAAALPDAIARAFAAATEARPRPAYLEIPRDVLASDATGLPAPVSAPTRAARAAAAAEVAEAARRLCAARAPVILAGGGALRAASEVRQLADALGAPVIMTINARGLLPPRSPAGHFIEPIAGADTSAAGRQRCGAGHRHGTGHDRLRHVFARQLPAAGAVDSHRYRGIAARAQHAARVGTAGRCA